MDLSRGFWALLPLLLQPPPGLSFSFPGLESRYPIFHVLSRHFIFHNPTQGVGTSTGKAGLLLETNHTLSPQLSERLCFSFPSRHQF